MEHNFLSNVSSSVMSYGLLGTPENTLIGLRNSLGEIKMNAHVHKARLQRTLLFNIIILVIVFSVVAIFFHRFLYARRCIEDWKGREFNTYTGYCISTSYYYDRLDGGWYLEMDNGSSYYVKSKFCADGSFRIEDLEAVCEQPITLISLPETCLYYNHMIVSISCGETELFNSQPVFDFMCHEASVPVIGIFVLLLGTLFSIGVLFEIKELKNFGKKKKRKNRKNS